MAKQARYLGDFPAPMRFTEDFKGKNSNVSGERIFRRERRMHECTAASPLRTGAQFA
jgi:hypothetical protein